MELSLYTGTLLCWYKFGLHSFSNREFLMLQNILMLQSASLRQQLREEPHMGVMHATWPRECGPSLNGVWKQGFLIVNSQCFNVIVNQCKVSMYLLMNSKRCSMVDSGFFTPLSEPLVLKMVPGSMILFIYSLLCYTDGNHNPLISNYCIYYWVRRAFKLFDWSFESNG